MNQEQSQLVEEEQKVETNKLDENQVEAPKSIFRTKRSYMPVELDKR